MKILCFGDSNTWGYKPDNTGRFAREERWPTVMGDILGDEYFIIEEGLCGRTTDSPRFSGTTSSGASGYSVLSKMVKKYYPFDMIIIMLGTNDLRPDMSHCTREIAENVGSLAKKVLDYEYENGGKTPAVIIVSPPHVKSGVSSSHSAYMFGIKEDAVVRSKDFAAHYKKIADELGVMFLDAAKYVENSDTDGLHLNDIGHNKLAHVLAYLISGLNED